MLNLANVDILEAVTSLKKSDLEFSFLVPTETGLEKSIMDATLPIRKHFIKAGLHNFDEQSQGPSDKVLINTSLITTDSSHAQTTTSLYRPLTKDGDPRIWIYDLKQHAKAGDLLALLVGKDRKELIIINCSTCKLPNLLNSNNKIFQELLAPLTIKASEVATELLQKMRAIAAQGPIITKRPGDTGVGFTLEELLGIRANSSKTPDYKGIEIKSSRVRNNKSNNRYTLFSKVPNWEISRLKGSAEILQARGHFDTKKQRLQLFHQLNAGKLNSYQMGLRIESNTGLLHQIYTENGNEHIDVSWEIPVLEDALAQKHKETFWVSAETKGVNGSSDEEFSYKTVRHTSEVDKSILSTLIERDVISVDYTITETISGAAKDQGYLFKIHPNNLDLIFQFSKTYDLTE
tara:strand:- start:96 stop:1310 length:1215 start_codon:yes stop_codon:yes gene_type:complete